MCPSDGRLQRQGGDAEAYELRRWFVNLGIARRGLSENWTDSSGTGRLFRKEGQSMNEVFVTPRKEALITASRLRAWWLVNYCGYRVAREMEHPVEGAFGRVRLVRLWALQGPIAADAASVVQPDEDDVE